MKSDKDKIKLLIKLLREANHIRRRQREIAYNATMRRLYVYDKFGIPWKDGYVERKAPKRIR